MAHLAGASLSGAASILSVSVLLALFTMPLLLELILGQTVPIPTGDLSRGLAASQRSWSSSSSTPSPPEPNPPSLPRGDHHPGVDRISSHPQRGSLQDGSPGDSSDPGVNCDILSYSRPECESSGSPAPFSDLLRPRDRDPSCHLRHNNDDRRLPTRPPVEQKPPSSSQPLTSPGRHDVDQSTSTNNRLAANALTPTRRCPLTRTVRPP